jgi:hypothetical protein
MKKNLLNEIDAYITIGQHRFPITLEVFGTQSRFIPATSSQPAEGGMTIECIGIDGDYNFSPELIEFIEDVIELDGLEA